MINVERQGKSSSWRLLLVGIPKIASVEAGTFESSPLGVLVTPRPDSEALQVLLP